METDFESKLGDFIRSSGIDAQQLHFGRSCHSVEEAAAAANAKKEDFVKNVCMVDGNGNAVVCIVKGEDRADGKKAAGLLGAVKIRMMNAQEVLGKTGYPPGGTPSFGYAATFLIDERVMEMGFVLSGGGSENSLVRISPVELLKANGERVAQVRR